MHNVVVVNKILIFILDQKHPGSKYKTTKKTRFVFIIHLPV